MEFLVTLVLILVFACAIQHGDFKRREELVRSVAASLGLGYQKGLMARGTFMGHRGEVSSVPMPKRGGGTVIENMVVVGTGLPGSLVVTPREESRGLIGAAFGPRRVRLGLREFDERFALRGLSRLEMTARMSDRARYAVEKVVGLLDVTVRGGELRWSEASSGSTDDRERFLVMVRLMIMLAHALSEHDGDPVKALLHHSFEDRDARFRRRAFELLIEQPGSSPEAREGLRRARTAPDPALRFLEARTRGAEGLETIRGLLDEELPPDLRQEALDLLEARFGGGLSVVDPDGRLSFEPERGGRLAMRG